MTVDEFDPNDGRQHVLSISYGKDSLACIGACEQLGWKIDRIITAEVFATDTISADLPPMVEFKSKADAWIKEHLGITVEHFRSKWTFESRFYTRKKCGALYGYPNRFANWCNSDLKMIALKNAAKSIDGNSASFVGIAFDEPERLERIHKSKDKISPLEGMKWTEADAMKWCIANGLRSPLYDSANRGGCWFCYNASIKELRYMWNICPQYFQMMMKWEEDALKDYADGNSPVPKRYRLGTSTKLSDFDKRFQMEKDGIISPNDRFKWSFLENPPERQLSLFNDERNSNGD